VPTPSHTEQLNNAKNAVELGIAEMIEQDYLNRHLLLANVRKILENSQFQERAKQIQEDVIKLNGLETAVQMIVETTEGGIADVSP
jgi:UDP:flavonoid glycosyltransferase YjiC (YdhE family)